jgi:hypothetical protein
MDVLLVSEKDAMELYIYVCREYKDEDVPVTTAHVRGGIIPRRDAWRRQTSRV